MVGIDFSGLKCFICVEAYCIHIKHIKSFDTATSSAPACVAELYELKSNTVTRSRTSTSLSRKKVMFSPSHVYQKALRDFPREVLGTCTIQDIDHLMLVGKHFLEDCTGPQHILGNFEHEKCFQKKTSVRNFETIVFLM